MKEVKEVKEVKVFMGFDSFLVTDERSLERLLELRKEDEELAILVDGKFLKKGEAVIF